MNIAYYISGHGYGHTIRSIEIIKKLLTSSSKIHVRTMAPQWLFNGLDPSRFIYHAVRLEGGIVQRNSFSVEKLETLKAYAELIDQKKDLLSAEESFLSKQNIDLVLSDITPLAFEAAAKPSIPAIAIGNFSWDFIYEPWITELPEYKYIVDDIKHSYAHARLLLKLPFYADMSVFKKQEKMPLVGRKSFKSKKELNKSLKKRLQTDRKVVLLGLRSTDMAEVEWSNVVRIDEVQFITTSTLLSGKNISSIPEGTLPFEDLLCGCDAIISKAGYSIVSEVIVNQTPILYVPRKDFVEDPALLKGLRTYSLCEELTQETFFRGQWQESLQRLFAKPVDWPYIRSDGASVIAEWILTMELF